MENIQNIISDISKEDRVEFLIDFLISELESDKITYYNIIKAINNIGGIIQNYDISSDLMSALSADCMNKMNILHKSVETSMELLDIIGEKFANTSNANIKGKISDLYKVNSEIYDLCNKCKNGMIFLT